MSKEEIETQFFPTYGFIAVDSGEFDVGRVGHKETSPKVRGANSGARPHAHDGVESDGPTHLKNGEVFVMKTASLDVITDKLRVS